MLLSSFWHEYLTVYLSVHHHTPILVATRSKAWVCGLSLAGIVGSNPARDVDICVSCLLCCL